MQPPPPFCSCPGKAEERLAGSAQAAALSSLAELLSSGGALDARRGQRQAAALCAMALEGGVLAAVLGAMRAHGMDAAIQ